VEPAAWPHAAISKKAGGVKVRSAITGPLRAGVATAVAVLVALACAVMPIAAAPAGALDRPTAAAVVVQHPAIQLAAGHADECEVLTTRTAECWGWNYFGQVGDDSRSAANEPKPVRGLTDVEQLAVGYASACALLESGIVKCWGWNNNGQLGDDSERSSSVPVEVHGLSHVKQIALGFGQSCALLNTGIVKCWGWNFFGQLGDGTTSTRVTPVIVRGLGAATQVAAGGGQTCAILKNGDAKCWGLGTSGQLGSGSNTSSKLPVEVVGLSRVRQLALGYAQSCALLDAGTVKCWGANGDGQLGDGTKAQSSRPVSVKGLHGAAQISVGFGHACAVLTADIVRCWGLNLNGQLGNGNVSNSLVPAATTRLAGVIQVTTQDAGTCVLLRVHLYSCWGENSNGELGNDTTKPVIVPPYLPSAPRSVNAEARIRGATISWAAPSTPGVSAITRYVVTTTDTTTHANGGQTCQWTSGPLSCSFSSLTDGDDYTVTVVAQNIVGKGDLGRSSDFVPAAVPGEPTDVAGTAGNAQAVVTWDAPSEDGGSAITGYVITATDTTTPGNGGQTCTWSTGALTCTVTGLTNGDAYTFRAYAVNKAGSGSQSNASGAITPVTVPGAPTGVGATAGNGSALVSWTAPTQNGGAAISHYTVTADDTTTAANGGETCTDAAATHPSCTVDGLTDGDEYTFTVTATSTAGTSAASTPSAAVSPAGVAPGAPTGANATAEIESASVTWDAPASNGGSPMTGYTVTATDTTTAANGGETCAWTSGPLTCTVNGLTTGDTYTFAVTATNHYGTGPASEPSAPVVSL
jgi:alpha-tubulin suppressor-like RCC1 family protein